MQISVVIPLFNEADSLPELMAWIHRVMQSNNFSYEVIMIDDGSDDKSAHSLGYSIVFLLNQALASLPQGKFIEGE